MTLTSCWLCRLPLEEPPRLRLWSRVLTNVFLLGHLSDGDSPELLPRQQAPPVTTSREMACDVSCFRLYVGSDPQRCSQRVTGLLTVHLLGLEEMKTGR